MTLTSFCRSAVSNLPFLLMSQFAGQALAEEHIDEQLGIQHSHVAVTADIAIAVSRGGQTGRVLRNVGRDLVLGVRA